MSGGLKDTDKIQISFMYTKLIPFLTLNF